MAASRLQGIADMTALPVAQVVAHSARQLGRGAMAVFIGVLVVAAVEHRGEQRRADD